MGDRIVVMLDGEIQQVATPLELYNQPVNRFVATFIGSPPMNILPGCISEEHGRLLFVGQDDVCRLSVPDSAAAPLRGHVDREVLLGIRPEDLKENLSQTPKPGESLVAPVEVVEPMGAETNLYLRVAGETIVARIRPDAQPDEGVDHVLDVDTARLHFFDGETEMAIR